MIKIEAIIRPEKVIDVINALQDTGVTGYSYYNVTGVGRQKGVEVFTGRGAKVAHRAAVPKTLIILVVDESIKDKVIAAILQAARSGQDGAIGDGKIFVSLITDVIRVSTGEIGKTAL